MQDDAHLQLLSLDEIAARCAAETQRYLQHALSHDVRFCYELFRRALVENNQDAYTQLCRCYADLVARWVRRRLRFAFTDQDVEACVNWAFASMFRSLARPGAFARFTALERLLSYLRSCAYSAAETENRSVYVQETELAEDIPAATGDDLLDPILQAAQAETVRRLVDAILKDDRERTVYEAYFSLRLPPRTIYEMYPALFRDVQDVHRVKQVMLERISRSLHKARQELGL